MNQSSLGLKSINPWIMAMRPKTLVAGAIPILVGAFCSALPFSKMNWGILFSALLFSVLTQLSVNLINDALDFKKGKDTKNRVGPTRVTQSGLLTSSQVLSGGFALLFLAFLVSIPLILKGGVPIFALVVASLMCSYLYTGGPYPLAYIGLGEVFVLLFYGFAAVISSYYLQTGKVSPDSIVASLQIGLLATVLIAINNLRDIHEDRSTGKRTLAARFGITFGKWEITLLIVLPFLLNGYWYFTERYLAFFLPSTALLIAYNLVRGIWKHSPSRLYNRFLGESSLLLAIFGLMLVIGLHVNY